MSPVPRVQQNDFDSLPIENIAQPNTHAGMGPASSVVNVTDETVTVAARTHTQPGPTAVLAASGTQASLVCPSSSANVYTQLSTSLLQHQRFDRTEDLFLEDLMPPTFSGTDFDATDWLLDESMLEDENGDMIFGGTTQAITQTLPPALTILRPHNVNETNPAVQDLRRVWHVSTPVSLDDRRSSRESTQVNATQPPQDDIDEIYRTRMAQQLHTISLDTSLPSIDFLVCTCIATGSISQFQQTLELTMSQNICIHLFFSRFNAAIPIVHGPTFKPSRDNILMVLTMCAAGAMTMDSEVGTRHASVLFERTIKAGNGGPWEKMLVERPDLIKDNLKGAVVGQVHALISRDIYKRAMADAYHGTLISVGHIVSTPFQGYY